MRILLVNPPDEMDIMLGVGREFVQKYEPLGILYIAAVLRDRGHQVSVIDAFAEEIGTAEIVRRIEDASPDVVGLSTLTCSGSIVYAIGQELKTLHPGMLVILGNVHASVFAEQYLLNHCCDLVVHGEGEFVMASILERFESDHDWGKVPGISYLDNRGGVVRTGAPEEPPDPAMLPPPARDLVDRKWYGLSNISNQLYVPGSSNRAMTMVTSRGCPYRCTFCVVHQSGKPRYDLPARVVDEMERLEKDYGASYVYIQDPLFMGDLDRVREICAGIRRRRLTIRWGCDSRVRPLDPEFVRLIDEANCYELSLGFESGVQRLLDVVQKKTTLEQSQQAARVIKEHSDILLEGLFILGIPSETREESLQTIRFARSLPIDMAQFSIFMPYPGSAVFRELADEGRIDTGVRDDGGVDPSVWRRYSSYVCFNDVEPIWVTPTLGVDQIRDLQKRALREFYLRPSQIWRQVKRIRPGNVWKMARIALKGFL